MNGTRKVAFGGILTAVAVVLLFLSSVLPSGRFVLPIAAGLVIFVAAREFSGSLGVIVYIAVSLLGFLVCADKTGVLCFTLIFGYYPLIKRKINYIKNKLAVWVLKFLLFTVVFVAFMLISKYVLGIDLTSVSLFGIDLSQYTFWGITLNTPLLFILFLYIAFLIFAFIYDFFLIKFYPFYDFKIHHRLP